MSARVLLEKRAILLQRLAHKILSSPGIKLSSLESFVGDSTLDKDMGMILSVLFASNNLSSPGSVSSSPAHILDQIREGLESRGIKLPGFRRRFDWVQKSSGGTFVNQSPDGSSEDLKGLDKSFKRIQEKMYEIRLHDSGHERDNLGRVTTKYDGAQLLSLLNDLIASVKKVSVHHMSEDSGVRTDTKKDKFLDQRYDEVAARINSATKTSASGHKITLLYLNKGKGRYVVSESELPSLVEAVRLSDPSWDAEANSKYEYPQDLLEHPEPAQISVTFDESSDMSSINARLNALKDRTKDKVSISVEGNVASLSSVSLPLLEKIVDHLESAFGATPGLMRNSTSAERYKAEMQALSELGQPGDSGAIIVRTLSLPFSPDQVDEEFASAELVEESFIGKNVSKVVLEIMTRTRFSGFVEFDDKYRMIVLWANAADDNQKDVGGSTFRDHLKKILSSKRSSFESILGQAPAVVDTKSGAALYFPRPASLPHVIKNMDKIEKLISDTNSVIDQMEQHAALGRKVVRNLTEDEVPVSLEETG